MYKQLQNLGFLLVGGFERSFDPGKPSCSTAGGVNNRQGLLKKALALGNQGFHRLKMGCNPPKVQFLKEGKLMMHQWTPMNKGMATTDTYGYPG